MGEAAQVPTQWSAGAAAAYVEGREGEQGKQEEEQISGFRGHDRPYLDWFDAPILPLFHGDGSVHV